MLEAVKHQVRKMPRVRKLVSDVRQIMRGQPPLTLGSIYDDGFLEKLIGKKDAVFLDIGCNDGSDTLWLLKAFPEARVYSFEPDARARKRYVSKVTDPRAMLFDVAVSNSDGTAEFHASSGTNPVTDGREQCEEGWDLSGSLRKPKLHIDAHPWCTFDQTITVKTMKLDTWVKETGVSVIDLIWADVQGAEADLIAGGKEALKNTRYFYTEYNNEELYEGQMNLKRLLNLLPDFKLLHNYGNDVLLKNKRFP